MTEPALLPTAQMQRLALLPLASPCPRIPRARIARQLGRCAQPWAHLSGRFPAGVDTAGLGTMLREGVAKPFIRVSFKRFPGPAVLCCCLENRAHPMVPKKVSALKEILG
ncbi:hypothetical protein TREES_T100008671 [Tupaia chinensis]|uniref:Uncharacterized protein n=1 Tax=Tupaia chinensis TaxID=246437 RepID=L9L7G7_TUPCH|nr:hypothetical protein TREES_T100008671 [Tupaia chinensis]